MAVKYTLSLKGNPGDVNAPKKFYGSAKSVGSISLRQISKKIADISTVSSVDVMAVLEALLYVIPEQISEGKIVRLGDFGSFKLSIKTEGSLLEENFSTHNIIKNRLVFTPGKEIKKTLSHIDYEKEAKVIMK
jgi:predicted histone-like DNA-binding protein